MRNVIVILGPTTSGKSALGVQLAKQFGGVVVSADSRQVYKGLDVCFGTVTKREMRGVPHYLLRFVSLKKQFTAADFAQTFQRVLKRIPVSKPIFLVGGSPFYIEAALNPGSLASVPSNPTLRKQLAKLSLVQLNARLKKLDPVRAQSIDAKNRRRVERAVEVARGQELVARSEALGTSSQQLGSDVTIPFRILKLGLRVPRTRLYQQIDARVDARLKSGMLAEVQRAHRHGITWQRLESLGLEPRFLSRTLRGQLTADQATEQLKGAIHHFARRQLTWWRRDRAIHWIRNAAQAMRHSRVFLKQ